MVHRRISGHIGNAISAAASADRPSPARSLLRCATRGHCAPQSPWQTQAPEGEASKPTRIGHSIRHKVHKLVPDGNSKLTIVGIKRKGSSLLERIHEQVP